MRRLAAWAASAIALAVSAGGFIAPPAFALQGQSKPTPPQFAELAAEASSRSDWATAIEHYSAAIEAGGAGPELFYNLGTMYAQSGDSGRAIWMFVTAKRLAPRDRDIRHNLNFLAPDLESQITILPIRPLQFAHGLMSLNEWAFVAGVFTVLAGGLFSVFFVLGKRPRARGWLKKAACCVLAIALVSHVATGIKYYEEVVSHGAIVVGESTFGRSRPSEDAVTDDYPLQPGTFVRVEDAGVEGWIKVLWLGGNEAYIRSDQVELL